MDAPEKESVHASCCIRMEEIAKSVIVRADDFQHLIENLFHLPHQCELGAGAVEVVIRASNMEIMVALQIVSQKTDAAFQRHEPCTPCKALFFCHAHGCPGSGEIPFGEHFVQMQVKMDFALVRFVLSAVVGTGADGIAEVVGRKSRHHGVEVNDTDAFSGRGIDEDIVDLGVIVGDAQRNFASCQLAENVVDSKALAANEQIQKEKELVAQVEVLQQQLKEKQIEEEADEVVKTYDVVLRVKPEKVSQIKSEVINGQKCLVIPMAEDEHANVNGVNTTV